jgi:2-methylcitrate dehydratase
MDPVIEAIAAYAARVDYADLPAEVIERARHLVIDAVGCALGACDSPPVKVAMALAAEMQSSRPATIMVSGIRTTPDMAAFVNGSMIRYLDYNDTYTGKGTVHPSDMLAVSLAATEYAGGDGKMLLLGVVLGYEILCSLTDNGAMQNSKGEASLWDQATYGVISAAAVAAKLLGLDQQQIGHAVSLAVSSHLSMGQIRTGQISHWKGCAVANACRNGMFCALLAARGMTGPAHVFDGPRGFFASTDCRFQMQPMGAESGGYKIMTARVKPYPAGYFSQSAIEAVLELRSQVPHADQVRHIRLETFPSGFRVMGSDPSRWFPETRESADHSLPFVMAMALMDGELKARHYDEERFRHDDVRALMAKIEIVVGEESVQAWPAVPLNVLHIELADGTRLQTRVAHHLGHYTRLMTDEQQEHKFRAMAQENAGLSPARTTELLLNLRALQDASGMAALMTLTRPPLPL